MNGSDDQQQPGQDIDADLRQEMDAIRSLANNQSQIIKSLQRAQIEHEEEINNLLKQLEILSNNQGES